MRNIEPAAATKRIKVDKSDIERERAENTEVEDMEAV